MGLLGALAGRELLFLALVSAIGAFPAACLFRRAPILLRAGFAPVLGLSGATCVFSSLIWFFPASSTDWLLPVLAVLSLGGACLLARAFRRKAIEPAGPTRGARMRAAGIAKLAIVGIIALGPSSAALIELHSTGPVAYQVFDAVDYLAMQEGAQHQSMHSAAVDPNPGASLVQQVYTALSKSPQEVEMSAVAANIDDLTGLGATQTQSAFLIGALAVGALAIAASVWLALGAASWWGVLAGALCSGAFFLQLVFDGSEGAIVGLAVLVPLALFVQRLVVTRDRLLVVPVVCLLGGLYSFYPVYLYVVAGTAFCGLVYYGARTGAWRRLVLGASFVVICSMACSPVGAWRAVDDIVHTLRGTFVGSSFPEYRLYWKMLPGWILQTVGLYQFADSTHPLVSIVVATVLPGALIVAIAVVLMRKAEALVLVPAIGICVAGAIYQVVRGHCPYCGERNLVPLALFGIFLVAVFLGTLAGRPARASMVGAVCISLVAAGFIGHAAWLAYNRFESGSYVLTRSVDALIARVPKGATLDLEGFGSGPGLSSVAELPVTYDAAYEALGRRVSIPADRAKMLALDYVGPYPLEGPVFDPAYRYVLTRLGTVRSFRRVVARSGGYVLERRVARLDVTVEGGTEVPTLPGHPGSLSAFVDGRMKFIVSGPSRPDPTVRFALGVPVGLSSPNAARLRALGHLSGPVWNGCVTTATVTAAIHTAMVALPRAGLVLRSMRASTRPCPSRYPTFR